MSFDYEKSIWGKGTASKKISDPTSIRFVRALNALKGLNIGDKVLEIGCGAGQFIRGIKKFRSELDCYGSDISLLAIEKAELSGDGVDYKHQETDKLPYEDGFFDAVIILDVLEHAQNWKKILEETSRVLKKDGVSYMFIPCEGSRVSFWRWLRFLGIGADLTKKFAGHINYFSKKEIFEELSRINLRYSVSYSEHILGQLIGIAAFFGMEQSSKDKKTQINNEEFFEKHEGSRIFNCLKKLVNSLVYIESLLLNGIPSPNLHLVVKK